MQWGPFLGVTVVVLLLLLVLARQSQQFINERAVTASERSLPDENGQPTDDAEESTDSTSEIEVTPKSESTSQVESSSQSEVAVQTDSTSQTEVTARPEALLRTEKSTHHVNESDVGRRDSRETDRDVVLTPRMLLANVAFTQFLVVAILAGAAWYFSIPAWAFGVVTGEPMSTGLPGVAVGIAFGVVLWLINEFATAVADAVGAAYDEAVREMLAPNTALGWLFLFGGVLPLIAFAEELLFRAALIGVPAAGFGVSPWALAVVSSLAFALGHGAQGRVGIVVTGILGFTLAAGYIVTGSLLVVVVAHYVINALEFLVHELLGVEELLPSAV